MKNTKKCSCRKYLELIIIFCSVILFGWSVLCDKGWSPVWSFLSLKFLNKDELLLTLFGVQASVSTISVAIIALISGVISDSAYGISFTKFISNLKPYFLKHNRLIICSIFMIAVNYFLISYNCFNASLVIFLISIVISIILVGDTYIVFKGRKEIEEQIKDYITKNYRNQGIEEIGNYLLENGGADNYTSLKNNIDLLKNIFIKEIHTIDDGEKTASIELMETLISDVFNYTLNKKDAKSIQYLLNIVCDIYVEANERKNIIALNLWDNISMGYFSALKILSDYQDFEKGIVFRLHSSLYVNQQIIIKDNKNIYKNAYDLKYYSAWVYAAFSHKDESIELKTNRTQLIEWLYDGITLLLDKKELGEMKKEELTHELCYFIRSLIFAGECDSIRALYFENVYRKNEDKYKVSYTIILIYLYYLSSREPLVDDKRVKGYAKRIIDDNTSNIFYLFLTMGFSNIIIHNYNFIYNILDRWEELPEKESKCIIVDGVINDFIIFTLLNIYKNNDKNLFKKEVSMVLERLSNGSMFSLYDDYFVKDRINKYFSHFNKLFFNKTSDEDYDTAINTLKKIFNEKYKEETIRKGENEKITSKSMKNFEENIKRVLITMFEKHPQIFNGGKNSNIKDTEYTIKKTCIGTFHLHNFIINEDKMDEQLSDCVINMGISAFISSMKSKLIFKNMNYKDKNKQEEYIRFIKNNNINGDTIISEKWPFFFPYEDDKQLLSRYVEQMDKIEYPEGMNYYCIVDSSKLEFCIEDIEVVFNDLSEKEFEKYCRNSEENGLEYNVVNNIFIPFKYDELVQHMKNTQKNIQINATLKYRIKDDSVGTVLLVDYSDY